MKKQIKIRHVYTVTREFKVSSDKELEEEIEAFGGVQDEAGEYLYGGGDGKEDIDVEMQVSIDGGRNWDTTTGEYR